MGDVQLDSVTKRYGDVTAVEEMNLRVEDGEFVTLVGPSGCGKSTTMEMVAGLTDPSDGTVHITGRNVTGLPPKDRGVAMVFQNIALFPHMNVEKNMSFGLRLRDFTDDEIRERVERAADIVQLEGMLDRMPDELSGGQRQRVAIARAIVREPEVFLMDEPLANLDAKLRVHMRTELQRLHKELDTTIVYVTHDQAEAMTMSDRIAVINEGRLQQIAAPLTCYNEPANEFVAGFIGSPSMNFVEGEATDDGFVGDDGRIAVAFDPADVGVSPGDALTLGVRPEDVHPATEADGLDGSDPTDVRVDVLEPMGDEIFVYLRTDDGEEVVVEGMEATSDQLLMSVAADHGVAEDDEFGVVLDRSRVHLFDADGDAIAHGVESIGVGVDADTDTGTAAGGAE